MTLAQANLKTCYRIKDTEQGTDAIAIRLRQLGFVTGVELSCHGHAPFFRFPILVKIRGTVVALSEAEALRVQVETIS